jgi:hypothetical protein
MRFLAITCRCGADLASAEVGKVHYRGKGKAKEPFAYCPEGCGRSYLVDAEGEPGPVTPAAEPEEAGEPEETGGEPEETGDEPEGTGDEPEGTGDEPEKTGEGGEPEPD